MAAVPQVARIHLGKILFPTDFSAASQAALPFALTLARLYGATVEIAHVLAPEPHRQVTVDRIPAQDDRQWEEAGNKLDWFTHNPSIGDVPHHTLLASGDLSEQIPALIAEHKIDMVVVGTHGRIGWNKVLMGSGAEKIYRSADCPVLTIGPQVQRANWKPRRILCPVDMSGIPEPAVRYASSLAEDNDGALILMQAIPMVPWQHRADVESEARARLEKLLPDHPKTQCLVRWEYPAEAVLQAAVDCEADLIVMGVRKSRAAGLSSHMPWPVASHVVGQASCPVLTVRI
jgi:nucleotide-binding universal stress UspA family protein